MVATAPTIKLLEAALPRALRRTAALPAAYGQTFALGSLRLTLHPAGHVLGSAQVRCEANGLDLVYAGDIGGMGSRASLTAEALEAVSAARWPCAPSTDTRAMPSRRASSCWSR